MLTLRLSDVPCAVRADPERLGEILRHLPSDAVKLTGPEGRVDVEALVPDDDRDHARVRVRDSGVGIPADRLDAFLAPFVQADGPRARTHEGAGLGLAIARAFARGMGGGLTVESVPGEGATFTVVLRRAVDAVGAPTDRRGDDRRQAERRASDRRGSCRPLVHRAGRADRVEIT